MRRLQDQPDRVLALLGGGRSDTRSCRRARLCSRLALSAFLAGLATSEGPVTALARQRLLPFRDIFAVFFFVAVGSLIDPAGIPSALKWIAGVVGLVLVVKAGSILGLARAPAAGHLFRITNGAAAGMSAASLQKRAGHSAFSTTQGYIDLAGVEFPKENAKHAERLWGASTGTRSRYEVAAEPLEEPDARAQIRLNGAA